MAVLGLANNYDVSVKFLADLGNYVKGVETASKKIEQYGKRATKVGLSLTKSLTAPMIAFGTAAINASMKFNKGMANVASLMPGQTERMLELKNAVLDLAVAVGEQPGMLTDGLYEMISAFGDSADMMKKMRLMADMAKAGQASLKEAIKLTSGVTKAYGDTSFEAMQKVSDLSLLTVRLGQTTFPELAASMGQVVPLAGEMGISIEEVMAVMATLTGVTGNTTEVATQFTSALTGLIKQSGSMTNAIRALGFETSKAMVSELGYVGALEALVATTDGTTEALAELFGRKEAVLQVLALLGPQSETFTEKLGEMVVGLGTTDEALKEQIGGLNALGHQWDIFKAKLAKAAIVAGDELGPILMTLLDEAIMPLLDKIIDLVKKFSEFDVKTQQVILGIAGIVTIIGPLLIGLGSVITVVGTIIGLIGAVAAGIIAIIGGLTWIITHWDEFTGSWRGAWLEIQRQIIEIGIIFTQLWDEIYTAWVKLWDDIVGYFALQIERIKNKAGELTRGIRDSFTWLKEVLVGKSIVPDMINDILLEFARMEKGINRVMERVEDAMRDAFTSMPEYVGAAFAKAEAGVSGPMWKVEQAMRDRIAGRGRWGIPPEQELEGEIEPKGKKTANLIKGMFISISDTILDAARMLGRSIISGDIASALRNIFSMIGNAIAEHINTRIVAQIPGLGGGILGAIGGGLISGLLGSIFGGGGRGEDASSPVFVSAHISNWDQFFQFGTTLPVSFVYSGRGGGYDVDPHGRTMEGYLRGEHYDA